MNLISYLFLRFLILVTAILPFRLVYFLSDFFYLIIYNVVGYRKKVVKLNLNNSFPTLNEAEIVALSKRYYHHFCDIALESMKGFSMSKNQIIKRHHLLNPELADAFFEKGISVIALPAHYNNWEWGSMSPGLQIKHDIVAFYKPLSNKLVDKYVKGTRSKYRTLLASIRETALTFSNTVNAPSAFIMAADQSPSNLKDCYWVNFLNQPTACLHGPEKYSRKYKLPVVYVDIKKVRRGYYNLELVTICENPETMREGEITASYMNLLEQSILKDPAYWLWSHRRWKHRKQD